jgi:uncharacterized membrane protein
MSNAGVGRMRARGMRVRARYSWARLKVSFWFAPAVMSVVGVLVAWAMYWIDVNLPPVLPPDSHLVLSGSVDTLRSGLIGMASTTLATAGIVFTLLTLPLSTVAAQYGSRLLRVFLGDRTTQFVLGIFVGTFMYCIAGALSIAPVDQQPDPPQLTATVGLYLLIATFASLILLVQHISTMLQAPNIAAAAGAELMDVVFAEFPDAVKTGDDPNQTSQGALDDLKETEGYRVRVEKTGYIQYIDPESMLAVASEKDLVIRLLRKPGDFVWRETAVALVWPSAQAAGRPEEQIRRSFQVGHQRTPTQDVEYAVNQLVEMAVRAMSPAINDPFTAMTCLEYIGNGLALYSRLADQSPYFYGQKGRLRLVYERVTFNELLSAAFDMLRHCSCDNASVLLCMLDVVGAIGQVAKSPAERQALLRHVSLVQAESLAGDLVEQDRQLIQQKGNAVQSKLESTL